MGGWGWGEVRRIGVMCSKVRWGHHRPTRRTHRTHAHIRPGLAGPPARPGCGLIRVWGGEGGVGEGWRDSEELRAVYTRCFLLVVPPRSPSDLSGKSTIDRLGTGQGQARDKLGTG